MRIRDLRPNRTTQFKRKLHEAMDGIRDESHHVAEKTREQVEERPLLIMVGALIAGALLGRLFWRH